MQWCFCLLALTENVSLIMFQRFFFINTFPIMCTEHLICRLLQSKGKGMVIIIKFLKHMEADQYCVFFTASY